MSINKTKNNENIKISNKYMQGKIFPDFFLSLLQMHGYFKVSNPVWFTATNTKDKTNSTNRRFEKSSEAYNGFSLNTTCHKS